LPEFYVYDFILKSNTKFLDIIFNLTVVYLYVLIFNLIFNVIYDDTNEESNGIEN
jgi:hypothetical protein